MSFGNEWERTKEGTNSGGEIVEGVGGETEEEATLADAGVPNHQQLKQVIEFLARTRIHRNELIQSSKNHKTSNSLAIPIPLTRNRF